MTGRTGFRLPAGVFVPGSLCRAASVGIKQVLDRASEVNLVERDPRSGSGVRAVEQLYRDLVAEAAAFNQAAVAAGGKKPAPGEETVTRSDLVTTNEAADMLTMTPRRVRQLAADGFLTAHKIAGRLMFDRAEVAALAAARTHEEG